MSEKKQTYSEAVRKLEQLISQIENNELDIDALGSKLSEAQELIKFCKGKLYKTEKEINKILEQTDKE